MKTKCIYIGCVLLLQAISVCRAQNDLLIEFDKYNFTHGDPMLRLNLNLKIFIKNNSKDSISICKNARIFSYKLISDTLTFRSSKEGNDIINYYRRIKGTYNDEKLYFKANDFYTLTSNCDSFTRFHDALVSNQRPLMLAPKKYNRVQINLPLFDRINDKPVEKDTGTYKAVIKLLFSNGQLYETTYVYKITNEMRYQRNWHNNQGWDIARMNDSVKVYLAKYKGKSEYIRALIDYNNEICTKKYIDSSGWKYEGLKKLCKADSFLDFLFHHCDSDQLSAYFVFYYMYALLSRQFDENKAKELRKLLLKKLYSIDPKLCEMLLYYVERMEFEPRHKNSYFQKEEIEDFKEMYQQIMSKKK